RASAAAHSRAPGRSRPWQEPHRRALPARPRRRDPSSGFAFSPGQSAGNRALFATLAAFMAFAEDGHENCGMSCASRHGGPMRRSTTRVLVIDDNPDVRDTLRWLLESEGYEVAVAANGVEGLGVQRSAPAHIVVTDIFMPEQDGIETLWKFARSSPTWRS